MKKISYLVLCLLTINTYLKAQINTPSGSAHPFNSNASYAFGIMPGNLPSGGTFGKSQDAANAYNTWKTNYVRACGSQFRVLFDDGSSTVSEGIGYGMLLAAYAADKALFDGLYAYYKANSNGNGFMNWKIGGCTGASGTNGATDADEDVAMSLIVAACQWPGSSSPYNYTTEATNLITAINRCEIDTKSSSLGQISNGDGWIQCNTSGNTCRNPSYMAPAYFKAFAAFVPSIASPLNNVVSSCYNIVTSNANSSTGLVSNWSDQNGSPNTCNGPLEYGYESCRNPWRMATDALWNNDSRAVAICSKIAGYVQGVGATSVAGPVSMSGGTGTYHNATFISTFAAGITGSGASYQNLLNSMYSETVKVSDAPPAYFGNTLRCISMFVLTGNFWKPCGATPPPACTPPPASITTSGPTTFCSGGNVVLTANSGTGFTYQWQNNGTNISGSTAATYTANTAGKYTVSVTSNGCSTVSSAVVVTVNSAPAATITTSGSTTFCSGGNVVLTANSGSGFTYQWQNNGTAISGSTASSYTANAAGSYTVIVTSNGCSTVSSAVVVTVNSAPAATITTSGPTTFCAGGNVVLTANSGNGFTYQWQNNGTNINGSTANTYTVTTAGSYTVSVTSNGCNTQSSAVVVTVSTAQAATITASGPTTFCSGGNISLTANSGAGYTYQWKNNGSVLSGSTAVNYSATSSGSYTVVVNSNGCSTTSSPIAITVNPTPQASITTSSSPTNCGSTGVVLNANTGTGYTYQWKNNNTSISGATAAKYTASTSGGYTVTVTSNGCSASSAVTTVANCPVATGIINEGPGTELNIYPSPVTSLLELELKSANTENVQITLTNMLGKKIEAFDENVIKDNFKLSIDMSQYPAGIYFVSVKTNSSSFIKKIIKR